MKENSEDTIEKIYCNTCHTSTNHEVVYTFERENANDDFLSNPLSNKGELQQFTYRLLKCRGCDTPVLQELSTTYIGEEETSDQTFYPKRTKHAWSYKTFKQLDNKLSQIYHEVVDSYNNDSRTLTAIGLRTLLEGICADKGMQGNTLYQKIENLTSILPKNIVESLHKFRFMGNEATHELQPPQELELRRAIEVIEDLLNFLYELDYKARVLFEGNLFSPKVFNPSSKAVKLLLERDPLIPNGQKELYKALYLAGAKGLSIAEMAQKMQRTDQQIYGVLGALGRRVNNTEGIEGNPGISYIFEFVDNRNSGDIKNWGWKMRSELRKVLETEKYQWAKDWLS